MKKQFLTLAGLSLLIILLFVFLDPDSGPGELPARPAEAVKTGQDPRQGRETMTAARRSEEARRAAMHTAFAGLQDLRSQLKSRANFLKSRIWGLELPAAQAREISDKMKQAYVYLKNPLMLGAYADVSAIDRESRRVLAMLEDLNEVETVIEARKLENMADPEVIGDPG